ncbi:flagellar assembly protein FliW [Crenobacter cavernae]|uniref:Flagellar assembly factor FliW n=1 Tax=Crenobacter cavernae TaxID=2290923 RepID=A0ABY0FHC4_9NEIS|nr:flagellar assembly protein FliW [Crenobacter cavernae]RXZ44203.1 flagellar biosynthesis protein FliW [Crenobacter cavernae]
MLFNSRLLGPVEVDESTVIQFPHGLPAFEDCQRFKLFHEAGETAPRVFWMQSLDAPDVLFSVVDPASLGLRYEVELSAAEVDALQLARPEDAVVLVMVYKEGDAHADKHPLLAPLKANVRNPLIVNLAARRGLQQGGLACDIVFHNRG